MDVRRSINTRIWADEWFESLDHTEKLIWIYLLTNAHTNMLGIYELSIRKMSFETGVEQPVILKAFEGFERVRKAFVWLNRYVVLCNWVKNQAMNDNMVTSARNIYEALPKELKDSMITKGFGNPLKGFESLPKKEKEIEKEKEREKGLLPVGRKNTKQPSRKSKVAEIQYDHNGHPLRHKIIDPEKMMGLP